MIILLIIFLLLIFTDKSSPGGQIIRGILKFIGVLLLIGVAFCTIILLGAL